jgi:hypothetical protein
MLSARAASITAPDGDGLSAIVAERGEGVRRPTGGAHSWGRKGMGTIPHALISPRYNGDTVAAAVAVTGSVLRRTSRLVVPNRLRENDSWPQQRASRGGPMR